MEYKIELEPDFVEKLDAICEMLKTDKDRVIHTALTTFVSLYCDSNGNFNPKKAVILGNTRPDGSRRKLGVGYVLDEFIKSGIPYVRVFFDGHIVKVPQYCIQFI